MILYFQKQALWIVAFVFLVACASQNMDPALILPPEGESIDIQNLDITSGQTIFVPAYSKIYYTDQGRTLDLMVTLSVHNTDLSHPIIISSVRYYNTKGELVKEYLSKPQRLGPMASADFFVEADDTDNGVGTNLIVEWVAEEPVYEPVVETLMINTSGSQGLSFTSPGRVIKQFQ